MNSIERLPQSSRTLLRSTTVLTSIPQIVHELVQNSLDANASQIEVSVNMDLWQCCVRDNGQGIDKTDMSVLAKGGEDGRYGSSKARDEGSLDSVTTLGFRGEALASAADISILEISSRTPLALETWSIILKGGKPLYYGPSTRWKRERAGTTVVVRDAFYNLPVRRRTHQNSNQTFESIRRGLECTAMVFPHVAFSLENLVKEQNEGFGKGRILTIPKTSSSLATFRLLFGKDVCETFEDVDIREGDIHIQGFLGLEGIHTKLHQYIYLNYQLLSPCELHRIMDAKLASSSFGWNASETDVGVPTKRTLRRSPRKSERRLVYLLSVTLPSRLVDNCLEPAKAIVNVKNSGVLNELFEKIIHSFLVRNGFTASRKRSLDDPNDSPSKRLQVRKATECAEYSSDYLGNSRAVNSTLVIDSLNNTTKETQLAATLTDRIQDFKDVRDISQRHTFINTSRLRKTDVSPDERTPEWIQNTLGIWKNPTFGYGEDGIRSITTAVAQNSQSCSNPRANYFHELPSREEKFLATGLTSFTKTQLENAQVVGQVDRKFVACIFQETSTLSANQILVLVDQHAADERIRVERFLEEICNGFLQQGTNMGMKTVRLDPPIPILLNKFEAEVFRQNIQLYNVFTKWGFRLELAAEAEPSRAEPASTNECFQVLIGEIPELLSKKLLIGDELREFVKSYLARLVAEGCPTDLSHMNEPIHWTSALRLCPRELIDLINSKACRGAIMFNDSLDLDQCRRLMFQLSKTVWPFRCAHGRPSLIPLTNVELPEAVKKKAIHWSSLEISNVYDITGPFGGS